MDLRVAELDGARWIELRDVRPFGEGTDRRATLRVGVGERVVVRPFWLTEDALLAFLHDADGLKGATKAAADLRRSGGPDFLTLSRDERGWRLGGEIFHFDDPDAHLRFSFPVDAAAATAFLVDIARSVAMRAPAS